LTPHSDTVLLNKQTRFSR